MNELKYFLDTDNDFLLAYDKNTEFFVRYIPETDKWVDCDISFSQFRHDYCFRSVDREEALHIANGNLPDALLQQYINMIDKNKSK